VAGEEVARAVDLGPATGPVDDEPRVAAERVDDAGEAELASSSRRARPVVRERTNAAATPAGSAATRVPVAAGPGADRRSAGCPARSGVSTVPSSGTAGVPPA
jgi:hypothetical protein